MLVGIIGIEACHMMELIERHLREIAGLCRKYQVCRLELFMLAEAAFAKWLPCLNGIGER